MKLLVSAALLCYYVQHDTIMVMGQTFAEKVDEAYRQKVDEVAAKQKQTQPKKATTNLSSKGAPSDFTLKLEALRKGGGSMGKGGKMSKKTPTPSPSSIDDPTFTPTTTFSPTETFEPTTSTEFPTFTPTISTGGPSTFIETELPSFEPTISTDSPTTTQDTFPPIFTNGKGMMMGKMDMNGKGMKGMGGNKGMGKKNKKTDLPSASPAPTPSAAEPTPVSSPVTAPTAIPPVNVDCTPTVGDCIATVNELINTLDTLDNDAVVTLCGDTTLLTTSTLELQANRVLLCCETSGCQIENSGTDSILAVTGDSVTIASIIFANGISDTNGGNVAIFGGGSNSVINTTFRNGAADIAGGNLYVESDGSIRIENSIFDSGIATLNGGGVSIDRASTVSIIGSTFTENAASEGGALFSTKSDPASDGQLILIDDSTFEANAAEVGGVLAVTFLGQDAKLMILNSIFTDNFANTTAGIGAIIEFLDNLELTLEGNVADGNIGGSDPANQCDGFLTVSDENAVAPLCIEGDEDFPA